MVAGMLDLQLQVFITVAEKKNFSRAAEALHMTQPAVSQYIRKLEDNIGVRLLERTNKYVRLNKAGEIVYHHAKEISSLYTRMQNHINDLSNEANGPLSLGASYTFGEYILPHVLAKMKETYPGIQPTLTISNTCEIARLVLSNQLDVGIVEGHFKEEQLFQIEEVAKDDMVIIASANHPLSQRNNEIRKKELEEQTWILREVGSGTREAAEKVLEHLNISPTSIMYFSSTQSIKEAVGAGLGISLLSQWAIQKELQIGDLKVVDVKDMPFTRKFSVITTTPFQSKVLQAFIDLLKKSKELTIFH
jgi:DNA-binding transcriptional LysR family regulator